MIGSNRFARLVAEGLIASARVVPVPFERSWCIDAVVRTPLEAGSTTDTVATKPDAEGKGKLRRFDTIDAAAVYLRNAGIESFTVDTADAVSFANVDTKAVQVLETTMQIWDDDDDEVSRSDAAA